MAHPLSDLYRLFLFFLMIRRPPRSTLFPSPPLFRSTQDAVIRNFEIIGEASRNIERNCPEFTAAHPDLPLLNAYEMRNALAHGYFRVDLEIIWKTIQNDLPTLQRQIVDVLKDLKQAEG